MTERLYFQPNRPARVDTSDAIGRLARFAAVAMSMPLELCDGIQPGGTIGTVTPTPAGNGYVLPYTAATTWQNRASGLDPYLGNSITVCWYGILRDDAAAYLLDCIGGYGWRLNASTWAPGTLRIGLGAYWRGGGPEVNVSLTDGQLHTIIARYDGTSSAVELFFDGSLVLSSTLTIDPGAMSSPVFSMLDRTSGVKPHVMATAQAFAGWFTDDQVRIWSDNPWHIFEPENDEAFIPASTGGGTVTLAGATSSQANASSAAGITQAHALAGAPSNAANSSATGAISQTHAIATTNAAQQNASSAAGITVTGQLSPLASAQANPSSAGAIAQAHQLAAALSAQANPGATGAISQAHALAALPLVQGGISSVAGISQAHALAASACAQPNAGINAAILQTHILIHAPSIQDSIAAASAVVQQHILAAAAAQQANQGAVGAIQMPLNGQPSTQNNASGAGSINIHCILTAVGAGQKNLSGTGKISNGVVADAWLTNLTTTSYGIKKAGIPNDAPAWLKTDMEIMLGRRGNAVPVPVRQTLTFSATPTKGECEALYAYVNDVQDSLNRLITRFDS